MRGTVVKRLRKEARERIGGNKTYEERKKDYMTRTFFGKAKLTPSDIRSMELSARRHADKQKKRSKS